MAELIDLEQDLQELQTIFNQLQRTHNKTFITTEIKRIEELIQRKKLTIECKPTNNTTTDTMETAIPVTKQRYEVQLKAYAWDQSPKFVKLFITDINGADKLNNENVIVTFTSMSFLLKIQDLNGTDYKFEINRLLHSIDTARSYHKCKSDMIVIYCKKLKEDEKWDCLTTTAKLIKQVQERDTDESVPSASDDPTAGLMNMMKKMYDKGDSETKRIISKAWYEGHTKKNQPDHLNYLDAHDDL